MAGGKKIEIIKASSDAKPDVAVNATRKLVEQDKVQIMVGPLSGYEGIAVKDYAKTQPGITFINGSSGAQATTLVNPSPNFFRFNTDGAQWMVGLGDYAFNDKKLQEDGADRRGLLLPVLAGAGLHGRATARRAARSRTSPGCRSATRTTPRSSPSSRRTSTRSSRAGRRRRRQLPHPVRAGRRRQADDRRLDHGRPDGAELQGQAARIAARHAVGRPDRRLASTTPEWKKFVADYKANFKDGFPSPSLFAYGYYINMKAALDGLDAVKGDLSDGQEKYREALAKLKLEDADRRVKLDENRQAIGPTFITEVAKGADGNFYNKVVKVVPKVDQTPRTCRKAEFDKMGLGSRDVPNCP